MPRIKEFKGIGWAFGVFFKCAVKDTSLANYRILMAIGTHEVGLEEVRPLIELSAEDIESMSSSFYIVIVQVLNGELSVVVRGAGSANGIEAWRRIHHSYSPSMRATALTDFVQLMSPGQVESHRELLSSIADWQIRVDALGRDHGEKLT